MAKKHIYRVANDDVRREAQAAVAAIPITEGLFVIISEETRTLEQNALLWPCLRLFARNVKLAVDGEMALMDEETWKDVMTGAFTGEQARMVKYGGALILVGRSTSQMGKKEFADFLTFILSEMAARGLVLPARYSDDIAEYISRYGGCRENVEVRGASRLAGEASSAEGAPSTVGLESDFRRGK